MTGKRQESAAEVVLRHLQAGPASVPELLHRISGDDTLPDVGEPGWQLFTSHTISDTLDAVDALGALMGHQFISIDERRVITLTLPEAVNGVTCDRAAELRVEIEHLRQDREPDYLCNPDDWEYSVPWGERYIFDDEIEDIGGVVRYRVFYEGDDVFAANVPVELDDDGCPVRSEIQWFDSRAAAEAALRRLAAPEGQP